MNDTTIAEMRGRLEQHRQQHVLRFWTGLDAAQQDALLNQLAAIDFQLMDRLIEKWVRREPPAERFSRIEPIPVIPPVDPRRADCREAFEAGEDALRQGRVGLILVAGGQGTRLGYDGPKGAYPIGPVSKKSLFAFHAEKIHNLQRRYDCTLPWYIMVSAANEAATRAFFREHGYFGLQAADIHFFRQRMVPCVNQEGQFLLAEPHRLAMNPNGHGGCLPAMVENGVTQDARNRGVTTLSYFQVDNWAVKVADPYFIGYHLVRNAGMSSKNHRKNHPREAVGVHCLCDGEYRVIEYSELDIYPQLLETTPEGQVVYYAGNPAIHCLNVDFVESVVTHFDAFPWHRAHKKIPHVDASGAHVKPEEPNGYKFETFVFDALRFTGHPPVGLEIQRAGEYTPIKSYEGPNSVVAAWRVMAQYWAAWFEAAHCPVPRNNDGRPADPIEISPAFALTQDEFVTKTADWDWPEGPPPAIGPEGAWLQPALSEA